jgi:hypothetical protein
LLALKPSTFKQNTDRLDVRESVHHSTIHKEKIQQVAKMYKNVIISHLYEA